MWALGVNEFAARLPSLLLLSGSGALVFALVRLRTGRDAALLAGAFFATTLCVFLAAGAVMTDAALLLGTTLSMVGFWIAAEFPAPRQRIAGYAFFVGLAIGMMAKGPVALVLTFVPIGAWTLWTRSWRTVWSRLPWITGTLLAAALAVPWYLAAERATPGFLDYFIVGEHWKRFVEPGWQGDLYGGAHAQPRGLIWLFWIGAAMPWSLAAIGWLVRALVFRRETLRTLIKDPWQSYLVLWAITPMLFFTMAGNILATYVLPGIPAFAILLATVWRTPAADSRAVRAPARQAIAATVVLSLVAIGVVVAMGSRFEAQLSQRKLVRTYEAQRASAEQRLVYIAKMPISADFYSHGKAILVRDSAAAQHYLEDHTRDFIVVRGHGLEALPPEVRARLTVVGSFGGYRLLLEGPG
jgi:4-amino-4-deoxy-L-arabinose transferase-like glycosyltransferase